MKTLKVLDMHTAGEPVRIFIQGMPALAGNTVLEQRRDALENHDWVRQLLMQEPRGHADMYGVWPVRPGHPEAALAVLFTHNGGYSTMCGHATIALGRFALEQGLVPAQVPLTRFVLECPCGPVEVEVEVNEQGQTGEVAFASVPAFVYQRDVRIELPGFGLISVDISYGGAFYALLPAARLGLNLATTPYEQLVAAGRLITNTLRAQFSIQHPDEPDLGFLYGTILTDEEQPVCQTGPHPVSYNLCIFGDGQVDRSPTGSGVTARMALAWAKGELQAGQVREYRGLSGQGFRASLHSIDEARQQVRVRVSGRGYPVGQAEFIWDEADPLGTGLSIPTRLNQLWTS